jgi:hypothetical protein
MVSQTAGDEPCRDGAAGGTSLLVPATSGRVVDLDEGHHVCNVPLTGRQAPGRFLDPAVVDADRVTGST